MSKTVQSVKNSLKFKALPRQGILSVRVGVKKYPVPVDARIISSGEYIFLSFPASSELYQVSGKQLTAMDSGADASAAYVELNPSRKRTRKRREAAAMPTALAEALKNIPAGFKLGYGTDGALRLVRKRKRSKKS
ncbi:MAG: hypothetical protein WAO58_11865 [Fimbriimonadaceae bacterium]